MDSREYKERYPERYAEGVELYFSNPENKKKIRTRRLLRIYGVSDEWFEEHSKDGCEICGDKPGPGDRNLDIDHDHNTEKVRGVLCQSCNIALGHLGGLAGLRKAIEYLENRG